MLTSSTIKLAAPIAGYMGLTHLAALVLDDIPMPDGVSTTVQVILFLAAALGLIPAVNKLVTSYVQRRIEVGDAERQELKALRQAERDRAVELAEVRGQLAAVTAERDRLANQLAQIQAGP